MRNCLVSDAFLHVYKAKDKPSRTGAEQWAAGLREGRRELGGALDGLRLGPAARRGAACHGETGCWAPVS